MTENKPQVIIRWHIGSLIILRPGAQWGSRPVFVATVCVDRHTVWLYGAAVPKPAGNEPAYQFGHADWDAMCDFFRQLGFTTISYERLNTGKSRIVQIDTTTRRRIPNPPETNP